MYDTVKTLHSYWAYIVLLILFIAAINSLVKRATGKDYLAFDFRISLFALIVSHLQLLIGIVLYLVSPRMALFGDLGMGGIMKNEVARLYLIEHPIINLIAIALITIGYSKHKKKLISKAKFNTIAIFYTIALVLFLSRIPWDVWLS
ncbi:50S ribosomal protein L27 [Mangrovimonas yunxiaonensis]|uniref:50S ribosomal protein L27 n=1 Tax=Mangrovimonas yunxiaonensis TaxID=1197477 RepID=A0A084TL54_9FLAO|nr:hypothetical protein [Mangrovimonas yunxiaonensis]KFB01440.1 50S ribosomal protein L27 [Mangrovimonas yunxiaonensis]MBR9756953.1 hypothetical protein [Algicola sp.]GGH36647.1 hypothetical protein GCM10011364_04090 [Mangrovimonas yunxiaonensis]